MLTMKKYYVSDPNYSEYWVIEASAVVVTEDGTLTLWAANNVMVAAFKVWDHFLEENIKLSNDDDHNIE